MSKQRWALRTRVEYALFRVARAMTALFSPTALAWIGGRIGDFFYLMGGRRQKVIDFNLGLAFPEKTGPERRTLAHEVSRHFGRSALDIIRIQRLRPDQLLETVEVVGWEHVERSVALGRGVFFLTAHMGSWEVAALVTGLRLEAGLAVVNRPLDNPLLEVELDRVRRLYGNHVFGKRSIAREMIRQLKHGGGVGILIDQRVEADVGVAVPFFGHPAKSMPIAAMIARRVGARIWIGRCIRIGNRACFDVNVNELRIPRTSNQAEDIRSITAAIQRRFETWIRETPEQFMWSNRRWF